MNEDDKNENSGIRVGGNFSMSGGALAVGKNAKAVNKVQSVPDMTALLNALTTLRKDLNTIHLPDTKRNIINKKLDALEEALKSNQPQTVTTVIAQLHESLQMADVNIDQTSTIAQSLDTLKQWASASRSMENNPDK